MCSFFYQSRDEAVEAADIHEMNSAASSADASNKNKSSGQRMRSLRRLPDPIVRFDPSPTGVWNCDGLEWFELFAPRRSESRIISANGNGSTVLYDADEGVILNTPSLHRHKGENPVCLSITHPGVQEDALYVMDSFPGRRHAVMGRTTPTRRSCFEVLECKGVWSWRLLPPPPFIHQDGSKPTMITSYTVVGDGTTVCISCKQNKIGTYCFDTMHPDPSHPLGGDNRDQWRHVGDWVLPFDGRAEYFPELKLWFGFTQCKRSHLCGVDLSGVDHGQRPIVQHVWEDLDLPEKQGRVPMRCRIINLGSGRFCVTKRSLMQNIRMFKHKTTRYIHTTPDEIMWFL